MIKAFLLDLDGVITESSKAHFKAWKKTSQNYGIDLEDTFEEALRGISREASLELILNTLHLTLTNHLKNDFLREKNRLYLELIDLYDSSDLNEGVIELFQLAQSKKIKIALVSASKNALVLIRTLGIASYFDYIVDPQKHPSKPAPNMFIDALNAFNIKPNEALGFEDAEAGLEAIIRAGIHPIGIGNFSNVSSFKSLKEALPYVEKIVKEAE